MFKKFLVVCIVSLGFGLASAQAPTQHVYPALDTDNAFTGLNSFSQSPQVPTPATTNSAANKGYVDTHIPPIATTVIAGIVKPDGTTITIAGDGTITAVNGNTTSTSLTSNIVPKANSANSIVNSEISDSGTVVTINAVIGANLLTSGTTWTPTPSSGVWTASGTSVAASGTGVSSCTISPTTPLAITSGVTYLITLTASITSGSAFLTIGDNGDSGRFPILAGANSITFTASSTNNLAILCGSAGTQTFSLTSISVRPLTGGTLNVTNGLNVTGGKVTITGGSTDPLLYLGDGPTAPETGTLVISQNLLNEPGGAHGIVIADNIYGRSATAGYGAIDCVSHFFGPLDHGQCFQARPNYVGVTIAGNTLEYESAPTMDSASSIGAFYHFFAESMAGGGFPGVEVGYAVNLVVDGVHSRYSFQSIGDFASHTPAAPNFFGGDSFLNATGAAGDFAAEAYYGGVFRLFDATNANSVNLDFHGGEFGTAGTPGILAVTDGTNVASITPSQAILWGTLNLEVLSDGNFATFGHNNKLLIFNQNSSANSFQISTSNSSGSGGFQSLFFNAGTTDFETNGGPFTVNSQTVCLANNNCGNYITTSGSGSLTSATSDIITVTGSTTSSKCVVSLTSAPPSFIGEFISSANGGTVTIGHLATVAAGVGVNVLCK